MAITDDTLTAIRESLEQAEHVEATGITVAADGGEVVLQGAVPSANQADVAVLVASQHADSVRNALRVDRMLGEDPTSPPVDPDAEAPQDRATRRHSSTHDQSVQTSNLSPEPVTEDLSTDPGLALAENIAWDPPDSPHLGVSESEQRGVLDHALEAEESEDAGDVEADGEPSLSDMSAAELARDARNQEQP